MLNGVHCILCESVNGLELHHVKSRREYPELVRDESNVVPMCFRCHDKFHSNSSKGRELRGTLNAILAHGNPQPSSQKVVPFVSEKVHRLMGEETTTNKPNTSAAHESDEIVGACGKL